MALGSNKDAFRKSFCPSPSEAKQTNDSFINGVFSINFGICPVFRMEGQRAASCFLLSPYFKSHTCNPLQFLQVCACLTPHEQRYWDLEKEKYQLCAVWQSPTPREDTGFKSCLNKTLQHAVKMQNCEATERAKLSTQISVYFVRMETFMLIILFVILLGLCGLAWKFLRRPIS